MTKLFEHDCDSCEYLYTDTRKKVDWYVCQDSIAPGDKGSILGRYGSRAPEYWSSPVSVVISAGPRDDDGFMAMAYRIVKSLGHIEGSWLRSKYHSEDGIYLLLDDVVPEVLAWSVFELVDGRKIGIGRNRQGVQALHFPTFSD